MTAVVASALGGQLRSPLKEERPHGAPFLWTEENVMRRLSLAAASAVVLLGSFSGSARASTFDFYETGITACSASVCIQPQQPTVLMTLTLSGPTETGSATYTFPSSPPVVTDPNLAFRLNAFGEHPIVAPDFGSFPLGFVLSYSITWADVAGELTAVSVNYLSDLDQVGFSAGSFRLTGGGIGSDGSIGGCGSGTCTVTGFWQREVPEPATLSVFGAALAGLCLIRRRYRKNAQKR
jgi:hypothetical protein